MAGYWQATGRDSFEYILDGQVIGGVENLNIQRLWAGWHQTRRNVVVSQSSKVAAQKALVRYFKKNRIIP